MLVALTISGVLIGVLLQFAVSAHTSAGAGRDSRLQCACELQSKPSVTRSCSPALVPLWPGARSLEPDIRSHRASSTGTQRATGCRFTDRISLLSSRRRGAVYLVSDIATSGKSIVIDKALLPSRSGVRFLPATDARLYEATWTSAGHEVHLGSVDAATSSIAFVALSRPQNRGAVVAVVIQRTFYLDQSGKRLMMRRGRSDVPLVDHVVALHFQCR
jgi:hypothetical protein